MFILSWIKSLFGRKQNIVQNKATDYLKSEQYILNKCFVNNTLRLKTSGFYSSQDYFNAVFDNTNDALRVSLEGISGADIKNVPAGTIVATDVQAAINELDTEKPTISSGTSAPVTTPTKVGDMFVDTTGKKVYIASGIVNSADWTILN